MLGKMKAVLDSEVARIREAGFDGHLVKPIAPADLVRLIADPESGS